MYIFDVMIAFEVDFEVDAACRKCHKKLQLNSKQTQHGSSLLIVQCGAGLGTLATSWSEHAPNR